MSASLGCLRWGYRIALTLFMCLAPLQELSEDESTGESIPFENNNHNNDNEQEKPPSQPGDDENEEDEDDEDEEGV